MFEGEEAYRQVEKANIFLYELNKMIKWESFRETIEKSYKKSEYAGGRPAYDKILMFKIVMLQRIYNLSDQSMERQMICDLSFKVFLGLAITETVPDEKTIWAFKEHLQKQGVIEKLHEKFLIQMGQGGVKISEGQIIDASFVEVPRQRNSREENRQIKEGEIPESFEEHPHKKRQKDVQARWSVRPKINHYGYKNSVIVDAEQKIIVAYQVDPAHVHDSQALEPLVKKSSPKRLHGDSAYRSKTISEELEKIGCENHIHQKGYRNTPLDEKARAQNKKKSEVRVRVEHVFASMKMSLHRALHVRVIGLQRVTGVVGLINLAYNMVRYRQILNSVDYHIRN